jgi:hypothetical protein
MEKHLGDGDDQYRECHDNVARRADVLEKKIKDGCVPV